MANWKWKVLRAGAFRLDGGAMFGVIPKALWSRLTDSDDDNRIPMQTNCMLLQNDAGANVLVETGYGNKFGSKDRSIFVLEDRWVENALAEAGVTRADISAVVVTHLHFDHAGGLTFLEGDNPTPQSSFPNATIHVQQQEWEDAVANKSTMTKTYLPEHLDPVQAQIQLHSGVSDVLPGLTVRPVPGHTWGQQAVLIEDSQGVVCFPGDMMPTRNHVGSAWNMAYDMLPHQNMLTKEDMLTDACDKNWRIVVDHEPGHPIVSVERDDRGRFMLKDAEGDVVG